MEMEIATHQRTVCRDIQNIAAQFHIPVRDVWNLGNIEYEIRSKR